jgi:hypothetical protein
MWALVIAGQLEGQRAMIVERLLRFVYLVEDDQIAGPRPPAQAPGWAEFANFVPPFVDCLARCGSEFPFVGPRAREPGQWT